MFIKEATNTCKLQTAPQGKALSQGKERRIIREMQEYFLFVCLPVTYHRERSLKKKKSKAIALGMFLLIQIIY